MIARAAVLKATGTDFEFEDVVLDDLRDDEVLVQVAGVGLCHTDLAVQHAHLDFPLPGVLGHEGGGTVVAVGSAVTAVAVGDSVIASFNSCGRCAQCLDGVPSYCVEFGPRNFGGTRPDGTSTIRDADGTVLGGNFFGQSAFADHAVFRERNVVTIPEGIDPAVAGPLGCGIQTGAGVVLNRFACTERDSLLVTGGGSVGLAAVLAAVSQGLHRIIVVDPLEARRSLARDLGATEVVDPAAGPIDQQVRAILPGGVTHAIDTTAVLPVLQQSVASLAQCGQLATVGVPSDPTATMSIGLLDLQGRGISICGVVEGDSDPEKFIPRLVELYLDGRFPFDRLITTMPLAEINAAIELQARGGAVKVILQPAHNDSGTGEH